MEITGKVAIVTGAGRQGGTGRTLAERLAREGASVVVSSIREPGGLETLRSIEAAGGRAAFCRADVCVETDVHALFAFAEKTYGGVDILVNNAGPAVLEAGPLERWFEVVQANLLGTMYGTLCGIEAMRRRGGGAIVNLGSVSALGHGRRHSGWAAYDAAKAGVIRLTTCLAWLKDKENIRVNCLVPDWVATEEVTAAIAAMTPEERDEWKVPAVLVSLGTIAEAVVRLITDEALAGRVLVCWCGEPPRLIPVGDPGYAALE